MLFRSRGWIVGLLPRPSLSTRNLELRTPLVHRRVLARQTRASSQSPISESRPMLTLQEQQRASDGRFSLISPSPIICCIAGLTPDNHSVTSSIDNQCNVYAKTDLWKRVRSPFRKLFTSISIGNIIGVSSIPETSRLCRKGSSTLLSRDSGRFPITSGKGVVRVQSTWLEGLKR